MYKYLIISIVFITSCAEKETIYYSHKNGISVTRIDKNAIIRLYYGKHKEHYPDSYIEFDHSGFDGVLDAFLVFNKDSTVECILLSGKTSIQHNNTSTKLKFTSYGGWDENKNRIDSLTQNLNNLTNVVEINSNLNVEREFYKRKQGVRDVTILYDNTK